MYIINILSLFLCYFQFLFYISSTNALKFEYHDDKELEKILKNFTVTTRSINSEIYSIGNSAYENIPLWVLKLSKANKSRSAIPNIKYVANIRGNEAVGRELLLHFMKYLRDNYEKDNIVKCLLDNSYIHLLPSMNPDGFHAATEGNCEGELGRKNSVKGEVENNDRNFPGLSHENINAVQPETKAIMKWMDEIPFILSAAIYGGNMAAKYPLDTIKDHKTPDNDVFENLASVYVSNHPKMKTHLCEDDKPATIMFEDGITNGAARKSFQGSMEDYNYEHGCMEVALEISCCRYPNASELEKLWNQNKKALLKYSLEALKGVSGQVLDDISRKPIGNAILKIVGRNITFKSTTNGEFWRMLLPGEYQIEIESPGYNKQIENFTVKIIKNTCPQPTKLQILLRKLSNLEKTTKDRVLERFGRSSAFNSTSETVLSQSRIVNEQIHRWPLPPNEEAEIFMMLFGPPRDFKKTNVSESDIRDFMQNDLGINDTSKFDEILKNFDSKTEEEKREIIVNLGKNLENVPESFTNVDILRNYIRKSLGIVDIAPYEDILKDFDKLNVIEKKKSLVKLLEKFHELSNNMTESFTQPTPKLSSSTASYSDKPNSSHFIKTYFSFELIIAVVVSIHFLCNCIHL